ncbi:MAG: hypothetical protein QM647_12335 [Asticcacaulis sp.]|uniref:hypothetical protein n=1 Tax=Asticcacaulis sp. TaxID=1872648 RepID=UPI0039E3DB30
MRIVYGFLAALLLTVIGFWPSFFSNPAQNDWLHIVHGTLATGWMLMLIAQAWLIHHGHVKAHHLIGRLSMGWVAALVVTAIAMVHVMLTDSVAHGMPGKLALILGFSDVTTLPLFAIFYGMAIWNAFRRNIDLHYRLMTSTLAFALIPAVGRIRWPWSHGLIDGLQTAYILVELMLVALLTYDFLKHKKILPPYVAALVAMVLIHVTAFHAPQIAPYMAIARMLGYVG